MGKYPSGAPGVHCVFAWDPDPALRSLVGEVLEDNGYRVERFASLEALRLCSSVVTPAAVVVTYWGSDFLSLSEASREEIRAVAARARTVLATSSAWAAQCGAAELGVHAILRKPYGVRDLTRAVRRCVAGTPAEGRRGTRAV